MFESNYDLVAKFLLLDEGGTLHTVCGRSSTFDADISNCKYLARMVYSVIGHCRLRNLQ